MRAMVFERPGAPLREVELPLPEPGPGEWLLRVHACGVCRTDLHLLDGEVEIPAPPIVPGHQIVGDGADVRGAGGRAVRNRAARRRAVARLDLWRVPLLPQRQGEPL